MEKANTPNPAAKKGKAEGLSKKERRATKVQEREKSDSKPTPSKPTPIANPPKGSSQLSEKELRKLEWEKKLAEQKKEPSEKESLEGLSKAQLREKRRQQQEAQRTTKTLPTPKPEIKDKKVTPTVTSPAKPVKKPEKKSPETGRLQLVNHLYRDSLKKTQFENTLVNYKNVHPAFVKLGVQYATKTILGSNARCLALLVALKRLVLDLQTPPQQEFCRYLESVLQSCVAYLQHCRPLAVSMSNALRSFKLKLQEATKEEENDKKDMLLNSITTYIRDEIGKAGEAISIKVNEKITDGDVILTYGCSSLIKLILLDAHKSQKKFEVIVVDGRPFLEGRQMLQRLVHAGIQCTYIQINALSYVMNQVTKVLLGAHALLTNGHVMSRIGTAQVALMAHSYNKPVLVCCETYKFCERVQTDSFVYNEIGDPEKLTSVDTLQERSPLLEKRDNLTILNLLYDVAPPHLITAVVTELAILPCTSAPVVLRIKPTEFA